MREKDRRLKEDRERPHRGDRKEELPKHGRKSAGHGIVIVSAAIVIVLFLICGFAGEIFFRSHFLPGTTVNGVSVSGMGVEAAKAALSSRADDYTLLLTERTADGGTATETISGNEIGLKLDLGDALSEELAVQSGGGWVLQLLSGGRKLEIETLTEIDETAWEEKMDSLQCFQDSFVAEPTDASLSDYQTGVGYEIVAETQGNQLDRDKAEEGIRQAVLALAETLDLETLNAYSTPAITSEDASLQELKTNLEKYTNVRIVYHFDDNEEVLDGDTISQWLSVDENNQVTLNSEGVTEYVATLRKSYDTIFRSRTFETSYGEEVTIDGGDYGWWMNYVQEGEELLAMIEAGESGERTPVYYQTAAAYGKQDYGNTYVEINLTAQHLFYYKDGEVVLESDFVSGNSSKGYDTPEGVYGVTYKQRNATLVGETYETPVSYWMPFNKNIGMHDATWRSKFGKNFYKSNGSHGCINLPYLVAKELYSQIEEGTAVICYRLSGTESDSVTKQSAEEIAQSAVDAIEAIGTVTKDSKDLIERARELYNDLSSSERKYVDNYDTLKEAEKAYKALS